jgi:tetratricopeptide (TPR) repeat protein
MRRRLTIAAATVVLLAAAAIAAWAALRSRDKSEWTTSSPQALAALERGLDAERKFYVAEARQHFARALALDPDFAAAKVWLLRSTPRKSPARKELIASLEKTDRSRLTPREAFLVDYSLDRVNDRYAAAQKRIAPFLAEHPRDPYALDLQVSALWDEQRWPEAEKTCQQLLAVEPNRVDAQNKLGYLSMSQGRFAEAEDRFRTYLYVAPDQANPHDSLGELFVLTGRWDEARRELETSIATRPDFCASYFHLSQMALVQRDVEQSRVEIERAARQPACVNEGIQVRRCNQKLWELFDRKDWPALSQAFDGEQCVKEMRAAIWMPHLAALMTDDLERAKQIEEQVAGWVREGGRGRQASLDHLRGVRLVAEGRPREAAERLAAADAVATYFGVDQGFFKLFNRLHWAHALEEAGDGERAAKLVEEVARVNAHMADLYRRGQIVLPDVKEEAAERGLR